MNGGEHHAQHDDDWQPATSAPGELFTVEGQIRAQGAFWRGLKNNDRRNRGYQRAMMRSAAMVIAMGIAVIAVIALVTSVF